MFTVSLHNGPRLSTARAGSVWGEMMTRAKGKGRKADERIEAEQGPAEQSRLAGEIHEILERLEYLNQQDLHSTSVDMIVDESAELNLRLTEKRRELAKLRNSSVTANPVRRAKGV
jgi:hypothetical protein